MSNPFTKRQLEIISELITKSNVESQMHVRHISLLYKNMLRPETIVTYTNYIKELDDINNEIYGMIKKYEQL